MTIENLREKLDSDGWPKTKPPAGALQDAARSLAIRRRLTLATVGVATTAVIATASAWAIGPGGEVDRSPVAGSSGQTDEALARPAAGYRYFAVGGLVTQVPSDLSVGDAECGTPISNTVVFGASLRECLFPEPPRLTVVRVVTDKLEPFDDTDAWMAEATKEGAAEGVRYATSDVEVSDSGEYAATIVVPEDGTVLHMTSPSEAVVEKFVSSIEMVPAEMVAIPWTDGMTADMASARISELGLTSDVIREKVADRSPGFVITTDPAAGTLVADGGAVTVHVAD